MSPAWQVYSLPLSHLGSPLCYYYLVASQESENLRSQVAKVVVLFTSELPVWTSGAQPVWPPGFCTHSVSKTGEQILSAVIQLLRETGGIFQEVCDLATYFQL